MNLIDVDHRRAAHVMLLFNLLAERTPEQAISHKQMPTLEEHFNFVESKPYAAWYVLGVDGILVGATYLSRQREIGIGILKAHRGNGYAEEGIRLLLEQHPGRHLANINPANEGSIALFRKLGFIGPIQITLERA